MSSIQNRKTLKKKKKKHMRFTSFGHGARGIFIHSNNQIIQSDRELIQQISIVFLSKIDQKKPWTGSDVGYSNINDSNLCGKLKLQAPEISQCSHPVPLPSIVQQCTYKADDPGQQVGLHIPQTASTEEKKCQPCQYQSVMTCILKVGS